MFDLYLDSLLIESFCTEEEAEAAADFVRETQPEAFVEIYEDFEY